MVEWKRQDGINTKNLRPSKGHNSSQWIVSAFDTSSKTGQRSPKLRQAMKTSLVWISRFTMTHNFFGYQKLHHLKLFFIYMHTYIHIYIHTYIHIYIYIYIYIYVCVCVCVYIYICTYMCMCIYLYMCVCPYNINHIY